MKLENAIKPYFTTDEMNITDEALELIATEIKEYIKDITQTTLQLGLHKTLMKQDVEMALRLRMWGEWIYYKDIVMTGYTKAYGTTD